MRHMSNQENKSMFLHKLVLMDTNIVTIEDGVSTHRSLTLTFEG